jgi:oxygen-independent coproporphyrinogen-3 oxidase
MAGIYLHIPFCKQQCTYCNFHFSTSLKGKDDMVVAIMRELELQRDHLKGAAIETIYFGGGTPSLLTADEIKRITETIEKNYPVAHIKEFTLEANPDDLTPQYLKELRDTMVNRFSIGVQSFKEADLRYMNRAHNVQQADYAIKAAQDAGFSKLTIDLSYGTPGLSDKEWKLNLSRVKELQIPHFSAYALTVEEGTALHHAIHKEKEVPVDQEQAAGQLELLMEQAARMGSEHYEISNLALPGHQAVHNSNYWKGEPYLGIGPSAHSFDGKNRRWNVANNVLYMNAVLKEGKLLFEEEHLTPEQHLNEYIMTSLRTMAGLDLDKVEREWDVRYAEAIGKSSHLFQEKRWIVQEGRKLVLTNAGKLFADRVAGEMFIL